MKNILSTALLKATQLTQAGRLGEATAALRHMLDASERASMAPDKATNPRREDPPTIDGVVEGTATRPTGGNGRAAQPTLPEALRGWLDRAGLGDFQTPGGPRSSPQPASASAPDHAQFLAKTFENQAGSRPYKLYVPGSYHGQPVPLIVMLHGCTQSPDDFAAGTRMNAAAEAHACLVAYPGQIRSANMQKCWNWFNEADQRRDAGEPSLIAGITREVMRDYAIDPARVYVAGLSAGGATAAIMGVAYPDLYAAISVHSGLPCGAAHDMSSAFAAMQRGSEGGGHQPAGSSRAGTQPRVLPTIVFHGERDSTVNPRNADAVVAQSGHGETLRTQAEEGRVPGGHAWRRTQYAGADGRTVMEQWTVYGAGHAWFGGSPDGSYTDPRGPDATGETMRFFLAHPRSTRPPN